MLDFWKSGRIAAPFAVGEPVCRRAFLFGSIAPDLGYFPGGDGLLADLAHCVRPADLARRLVASAMTDVERALAWGWATHVLGDIWIHPLINQAAGEFVSGQRYPGLTYADDPINHVRVEMGLDGSLPAVRNWPDPDLEIGLNPGASAITSLRQAYGQTYGLDCSPARMRVAHASADWVVPGLLLGGRVFSGRQVRTAGGGLFRGLRWVIGKVSPGGKLHAFTSPLAPADWLVAETAEVVETVAERFEPYYVSGLADLINSNLDTGELEGDPPSYPLTVAALSTLHRRTRGRDPVARNGGA